MTRKVGFGTNAQKYFKTIAASACSWGAFPFMGNFG